MSILTKLPSPLVILKHRWGPASEYISVVIPQWRWRIYWCDWKEDSLDGTDASLEQQVRQLLGRTFASYASLAEQLEELPWSLLVACNHLVTRGEATEGTGEPR